VARKTPDVARARARGAGRKNRRISRKPPGRGPGPRRFKAHWVEIRQYLEERPDQTAMELLTEFQARCPTLYSASHLRSLRRLMRVWRREAIQRLICEMKDLTQNVTATAG
jgi:hypothetical protein